jgi:Zn-dependent protease
VLQYLTCALREAEARPVDRQQLDPGELRLLTLLDEELAATGFRAVGFGTVSPNVTYFGRPLVTSVHINESIPAYALVRRHLAPEFGRLVELDVRTALACGDEILTVSTPFAVAFVPPGMRIEALPGLSVAALVQRHIARVEAERANGPIPEHGGLLHALRLITTDMAKTRSLFRERRWVAPTSDPRLDRFTLRGALALTLGSRRPAVQSAPRPEQAGKTPAHASVLATAEPAQAAAPSKQTAAASEPSAATSERLVEHAAAPSEQSVAISERAAVPPERSAAASERLVEHAAAPSEQSVAISERAAVPPEQSMGISESAAAPSERSAVISERLVEDAAAPSERWVAMSERSAAPSEQTPTASERSATPSERPAAASERSAAPSEQTPTASERSAARSERSAAASERSVAALERSSSPAAPQPPAAAAELSTAGAGTPPSRDPQTLRIEADLQAILHIAEHPDTAPGVPWPLLTVITATAALSFLAMAAIWDVGLAALILAVVAFHEAGHAAAMRLFGYRNVQVFFVPLLGAMTVGRPVATSVRNRLLVLLAGPVPGLWLAVVLLAIDLTQGPGGVLRKAALPLLILNALNLLPFTPLDGGRVLEALTRPESVWRLVVHGLSAAGILALAAVARDPTITAFGAFWAAMLPRSLASYRLRRTVAAKVSDRSDFRGVARATLEAMLAPPFRKLRAVARQATARATARVFAESLATPADRRWGAIAYACAWLPVVIAVALLIK